LIPADAAFYSATLRNREQIEIVARSKAWARLQELPAYQMAWQMVQAQYHQEGGQLAGLRQLYEQPENRELVALVREAVSDEVFCYAGESWADVLELAQEVSSSSTRFQPLLAQLQGRRDPKSAARSQAKAALDALAANLDLIKVPDLIIGFKVRDAKRVQAQLKRLEKFLNANLEDSPLKGRLKRAQVGDQSFLTLRLDGSLVPWDRVPIQQVEDSEGEYDTLIKKLKTMTLTISLGLHDQYLLVALGPTTKVVEQLGRGERLADRPELKPLARHADKPLTGISYISKAMMRRLGMTAKDVDGMAQTVKNFLNLAGLPEEKKKQIDKDVDGVAQDLKKALPELGALVSFSFRTDRGFEGYSYNYGQHRGVDGSKPLTLLSHVGGAPIAAVVGRSKSDPQSYRTAVKWLKVFYGHLDEIITERLPEEPKEKYEKVAKTFLPLLRRLDQITDKELLPALADGQSALVLDARWTSRRWFRNMAQADKPMPMLEVGLVLGVSDADQLRKALEEYRTTINEIIAKVRDQVPGRDLPDIKIPEPQSEMGKAGTLYFYPIPRAWGLDRRFVPTGGLSSSVAALSLSKAHSERLLEKTPLDVDSGPLGDQQRPLVGAGYFNWPALIDAVTPWVEMAVRRGGSEEETAAVPDGEEDRGAADPKGRKGVLEQVHTVLQVLKTFRGYTSATTVEEGHLVTHQEWVFKDLK